MAPSIDHVLVGVDGSDQARDATVLGRTLADVCGARLTLACAYAYDTPYAIVAYAALGQGDYKEQIEQEAERVLDEARAAAGAEAEAIAIRASSAPSALDRLARDREVDLVVVGSTHQGPIGRISPGSVADRLLAGAPCAVAVAPAGLAQDGADYRVAVVGAAFDGAEESRHALRLAADLARAAGATLRVIAVVESPGAPPATSFAMTLYANPPVEKVVETAGAEIDAALAELEIAGDVESVIEVGAPAPILIEQSAAVDLLVCGSRGYGLVRQVLLGGVSSRLIRGASCPVVVTPRSAA